MRRAFFYALIPLILYLGIPLFAIFILSYLNILKFEINFILFVIPFGVFATIMAFLQNLYAKGTTKYALIGIGLSLYRGFYLFYLFGGFFSIEQFGTYSIQAFGFQIRLYIEFIAIMLLAASFLNALYYFQLYHEAKIAGSPQIEQSNIREEIKS